MIASIGDRMGRLKWHYWKIVFISLFLIIVAASDLTSITPAMAADTDWAGTPVSENGVSVDNPGGASAEDGTSYAVFDSDSDWWQYTLDGLPTDIPAGAVITGIELNIRAQQIDSTSCDLEVRLSKNGTSWTNVHYETADFSTSSFSYQTIGGDSLLWGWAWSPSDFTSSGFWVRFDATSGTNSILVDYFQVKIYYVWTSGSHCGNSSNIYYTGNTWHNSSDAEVNDGYAAFVDLDDGQTSDYLKVDHFGFSIPSTATITGIEVTLDRSQDITAIFTYSITDNIIKLVDEDGIIGGTNLARTDEEWPEDSEWAYYGGPGELWGKYWNPSDIEDDDFGVVISVQNPDDFFGGSREAYVDCVWVTIYYTYTGEGAKTDPTLSVTNSPQIYNGTQKTATIAGSATGVVSDIKYNGSPTAPTNAGTYAITADFAPLDTVNYNTLDDAFAGYFIISKAQPGRSVTNSPQTFDGTQKAAIVEANVPGVVSDIKYDGFPTAPINIGIYDVTVDFTPDDTTNYNTLDDAFAGYFRIIDIYYDGTAGPQSGTGSNVYNIGNIWYNSSAVEVNDGFAAFVDLEDGETSDYLKVDHFGFSIPSTATITGIEVTLDRSQDITAIFTDSITDNIIKLVGEDGIVGGTNLARTDEEWPEDSEWASYGGLGELWGRYWNPCDIEDDDFGVVISVQNPGDFFGGSREAYVYYITITIYYEYPAGEVNVAPVLSAIGNQNLDELATLTFTATATDDDLPANTLTFSLSGEPAGASIDSSSGAFSWTPTEAQGPGVYTFDVVVSDGDLSDSEEIQVTVNEVNNAPDLTDPGDQEVDELATLTFTATATDEDLPANTLTFSLSGEPAGASIDSSSGAFSWTPTEAQGPGVYTFDVMVSDGDLSDSEEIQVTINEVNTAPDLTDPGDQEVDELATLTFTATATDDDQPANTPTFSLSGEPAGANIDSSSGAFSWTPTEAQGPGVYTFDVMVSDGDLSDSEEIQVTVNEVNIVPSLTDPGDQTVEWDNPLSFTLSATDNDLPANTLTYSIKSDIEAGMSLNSSIGAFSWTPTSAQIGVFTVTFMVTDDGDPVLSDEETITITVEKRSTILEYNGDLSVQYSDPASLSATLTDKVTGSPIVDEPIVFTITGHVLTAVNTDGSGVATTTHMVTDPAGSYCVLCNFDGDALYKASDDIDPLTVTKEIIRIHYIGDTFKWVNQDEIDDNDDDETSFNLKAVLKEDNDGSPGDLELLSVTFNLEAIIGDNPNSPYSADVDANGAVQITTDSDIGAGLYEITVQIEPNDYYTCAIDFRTISVPDWADRTTKVVGSGDIGESEVEGYTNKFGFEVWYGKKSPTGVFTFYYYVHEDGEDYVYKVTNNSWAKGGLFIIGEHGAYFESKATVKKIRLSDGENMVTSGNGKFYVQVLDNYIDEINTPDGIDEIAVTIWDGQQIAFEIGTLEGKGGSPPFDGVEVKSGDIIVIP